MRLDVASIHDVVTKQTQQLYLRGRAEFPIGGEVQADRAREPSGSTGWIWRKSRADSNSLDGRR
jgi:hypothetical protein